MVAFTAVVLSSRCAACRIVLLMVVLAPAGVTINPSRRAASNISQPILIHSIRFISSSLTYVYVDCITHPVGRDKSGPYALPMYPDYFVHVHDRASTPSFGVRVYRIAL